MSGSDYTFTPNLGLYKPIPNFDVGNWGTHWNNNADVLDALFPGGASAFLPLAGGTLTGPLNYAATGGTAVRSAQDRAGAALSLADFNDPSGGTDYTAALNAAIAATLAHSASGGKLLLPPGTFPIGSAIAATIPAGKTLTIEGVGQQASVLLFTNATDGLNFTLAHSGNAWGSVMLRDCAVVRGPTSPAMANTGLSIAADPTAGVMYGGKSGMRNVYVGGSSPLANSWMTSLAVSGTSQFVIDGCAIQCINAGATDQGDIGISLSGPNANQYGVSFLISKTVVQGASAGLQISGYVQGVFVSDSEIVGQYDGIRWSTGSAAGEKLAVCNSSLNAGHRGFYVNGINQCDLIGTVILRFGTGVAAGFAGVEIYDAGYCSVIGNNITAGNAANENGIIINASPQGGNVVIGNTIDSMSGTGIWLEGTTTGTTVIGNTVQTGVACIQQDTPGNITSGNIFKSVTRYFDDASQVVQFSAGGINVVGPVAAFGGITMANTSTPGTNNIWFDSTGAGPPTLTTRSQGEKITIYPTLSSSQADFAIGFASNAMWFGLAQASAAQSFQWFGGTTQVAGLDGAGNFSAAGGIASLGSATFAGPSIRAGAGAAAGTQPAGSLWLRTDGATGSRLYVSTGTAWNAVAGV